MVLKSIVCLHDLAVNQRCGGHFEKSDFETQNLFIKTSALPFMLLYKETEDLVEGE